MPDDRSGPEPAALNAQRDHGKYLLEPRRHMHYGMTDCVSALANMAVLRAEPQMPT